MGVIITGSVAIGGTASVDPVAPITATAGTTTTVTGTADVAITSFNTFSSVTGGYTYAPYIYKIISGTLPTGITLDSTTGTVSGTPTAGAQNSVTFAVTDVLNNQAATTLTVLFSISVYTVQYLVVGGGGGGGVYGGGGAGGVATGSVALVVCGASINVTVGLGGCGQTGSIPAPSGSNTTISGTGVSVITAVGGGGGGQNAATEFNTGGRPGGSGGGSGGRDGGPTSPLDGTSGGSGTQPSQNSGIPGVTNYGFPASPQESPYIGTGGGGAGGASLDPSALDAQPGGPGITWPFTATIYGGGGGAGAFGSPATTGSGSSPGGGGAGGKGPTPGVAGTDGLGGGGGGGGNDSGGGGPGGAGVAIFAYQSPTQVFTGGNVTTPPAAPGYFVHTFTVPGTLSGN